MFQKWCERKRLQRMKEDLCKTVGHVENETILCGRCEKKNIRLGWSRRWEVKRNETRRP